MIWTAGRITVVARNRVRVTSRTIDQSNGKTANARRSLKLPASVLTVLRGTEERQKIATKRAGEAAHEAVDCAGSRAMALSAQVAVHLAATVELFRFADRVPERGGEVRVGDRAGGRWCALPVAVRAWGDLHAVLGEHAADRLDPVVLCTHLIDELDYLRRRGSSSLAKKIDADFLNFVGFLEISVLTLGFLDALLLLGRCTGSLVGIDLSLTCPEPE